jgi:hypothetical protein
MKPAMTCTEDGRGTFEGGGYKSSKHSGQGTGVGRQLFPSLLLEGGLL